MLKCEICHDWCSRVKITKQWWEIAKNDWDSLNGKDLPYYIAILAVLRETTYEMFDDNETSKNHSKMEVDKNGYALAMNKNCEFVPLTLSEKDKWNGFNLAIKAFRNGSAHFSEVKPMNPIFSTKIGNSEDSFQNYYRYAPFPTLYSNFRKKTWFSDSELKQIHQFINQAILKDVRSPTSGTDSSRIIYEFLHVERGPLIDLLHTKMIELLKEAKVW